MSDQCDTANSVAQFLTHFIEDRGRQDQGLLYPYQQNPEEQASPFLDSSYDSSQTFRMDSLLSEMRDIEASSLSKNNVTNTPTPQSYTLDSKNENVSEWANQYIESGSTFAQIEDKPFLASIWSNDTQSSTTDEFERLTNPTGTNEFDLNANWGHEFSKEPPPHFASIPDILSSIPPFSPDASEIQYVAEQITVSMDEPQFSNSKFLKFMNTVSDGQVHIVDNQTTKTNEEFSKWASEPVSNVESDAVSGEATITEEAKNSFSQWGSLPMGNITSSADAADATESKADAVNAEDQYSKELWSKLTERWEQMNLGRQTPWPSEFSKFVASVQTYKFAEENPMADKVNALEEGKKRLESGDLPGAVLCFEAAVQQTPEGVEGWQLLGRTQAENEQDQQAIAALRKCLELDPANLEALKELAVCYTNESYQYQACYALKEWIKHHPKYKDIVEEEGDTTVRDSEASEVTSILSMQFFNEVLDMYLKAAQRSAGSETEADADVQNGLGVLLTLNSEFKKAIDCFEFAVQIRPDDARLWNRLGATLANDEKPERALEAYRTTLKLAPGFIRARYNLGITCIHLRMYRQAIEHLLIALNQQVSGRGINGEKSASMSDSIWTTLRLALSLSDRRELIPVAEKRDLNTLNKEFDIDENVVVEGIDAGNNDVV